MDESIRISSENPLNEHIERELNDQVIISAEKIAENTVLELKAINVSKRNIISKAGK